jgi:hypothetical protein
MGIRSWTVFTAALLPLMFAGVIYHSRSHDATSVLGVTDDQIAATIPDGIQVESPLRTVVSGNRSKVAYVGIKGSDRCLCVNNSVIRCSAGIGTIVMSGDGERVGWTEAFRNPLTGEVRWRVVIDGEPEADYLEIRNLQLASGSAKAGYIARSAEGSRYLFGDRTGQIYPDIRWSVLSPDGSRSFYLAAGDGRLKPVLDGVAGPPFDQLIAYSFSRNGRHLAYAGRDSDGTFLMSDGQRTSVPPELTDLVLSADGSRLCRVFKSPAGIWFSEGDKTSPVFRARGAIVSFSTTGKSINVALAMLDAGANQVWWGDDVTKLRRSRGAELSLIFRKNWWQAMGVDVGQISITGDSDGSLAWVERDGRHLLWRRSNWPPTHITKIDMASREPGLLESREAVLSALKDRSVERLLAYVAPDIRVGFGDPCCGVEYFRSAHNLDDPSSPFWEQAQQLIENGGLLTTFRGTHIFTAPYTFGLPLSLGPLLGADEIGLVTGNGSKLHAEPRINSTTLRTFDWEPAAFLTFANGNQEDAELEKDWARVRALDGREGYVERSVIASGFDLRAIFSKRNGRWIITAFVSGD